MAEKKRTFEDAFDMFRDIHNERLNLKDKRAKALEKRIQNLQEENKKLKEQVTASAGQACAIQPHNPRHMVNLLQVIEEVIPTVDFDKLSANNSLYEFSTLDAGQQLMIYIPQLLKTIDPDKEYEFCSISLNHRSIQDVPLDFNATVII